MSTLKMKTCLLKNINKKASEKLRKIFADINQGF